VQERGRWVQAFRPAFLFPHAIFFLYEGVVPQKTERRLPGKYLGFGNGGYPFANEGRRVFVGGLVFKYLLYIWGMAYRGGQTEIPSSKSYKKFAKKARMRKIRRQLKRKDIEIIPHFNRYHGYQ
jgi:hypothetical protein